MDQGLKYIKKLNPGWKANFFSKITFMFVWPIFFLTRRKNFNYDDVYEPIPALSSKALGSKLETEWNLEKVKKNSSFLALLFKVFGFQYTLLVLLFVSVEVIVMLVTPNLIGRIVTYFSSAHTHVNNNVAIYIVLLMGSIFFRAICVQSYNFAMKQLALKIKISCTALVYQKALQLTTNYATSTTCGQTITLITKDLAILDVAATLVPNLFTGIVKIFVMTYAIYKQIQVSAFVGVGALLSIIFLQAFLVNKMVHYRLKAVKETDKRIQFVQEMLSTIRVIKIYTWELFFCKSIDIIRRKEVRIIQISTLLYWLTRVLGILNGRLSIYTCIVTFVALGNDLNTEKAFVVVGCFATLGVTLNLYIPCGFKKIAEMRAMLIRINTYLRQNDNVSYRIVKQIDENSAKIVINNVTVNYENQIILRDIHLIIKPGITLITGSTASGKSTFLKIILGDTATIGTIEIFGCISYASQEPWLFPGTIQQNIIFNEDFNKSRYNKVLMVCALQKDLEAFTLGDETFLTDKGLNLSQGQKLRINLARAVYKSADIYLLDDCLSALDVQVGRHIFYECIKNFLCNKVCLLVSHLHPYINDVNKIVLIDKGFVTLQNGTELTDCSGMSSIRTKFSSEVRENNDSEEAVEHSTLSSKSTSALIKYIYQETGEQNSIKKGVYYKYLLAGGIKMFISLVTLLITIQVANSWSDYSVRLCVDSEQNMSAARIEYGTNLNEYDQARANRNSILYKYSAGILASVLVTITMVFVFIFFARQASVEIHRKSINAIVYATAAFFDKTLAGNIVNRLSRDMSIIDEFLANCILDSIEIALLIISILIVVSTTNLLYLVSSACFGVTFYVSRLLYVPSGRNIRRVEGSVRSPVIGHIQTTFDGLTTIRAYKAEDKVKKQFYKYFDVYNSVLYMHIATEQAFAFYLNILSGFYIAVVVIAAPFLKDSIGASTVGLAITQSFTLTGLLEWCAYQWSELEMHMTSTERIFEYAEIESENKPGNAYSVTPVIHSSKIVYKDVSLRYSQDSHFVLKHISFTINHGEKVGVVGRTGAGKSSIILALFRLYPFDGTITIGNVDINTLELDELRSKISIIPQQPILFSGTVRSNLDPNARYTDNELWNALEKVNMKGKINSLDLITTENSSTFSTGEKQLICLARVILQNNSIVILDEAATACVDSKTGHLIQEIIRRIFSSRTIILIAHRLHTVMDCDKILVIGTVVEYGNPKNLLNNEEGIFYAMAKEAGLLPNI